MPVQSYRDLEVWQLAMNLVIQVYESSALFVPPLQGSRIT